VGCCSGRMVVAVFETRRPASGRATAIQTEQVI
jgi:hypothetical protein